MKWFRKLLLPALNRPSTATLISSCPTDARVLARRPESAEISYRAATSAAKAKAGVTGIGERAVDGWLDCNRWDVRFVSGWMSCVLGIIAPHK